MKKEFVVKVLNVLKYVITFALGALGGNAL